MKYLITESQAKIAAVFLKLDMKKFIQVKEDGYIYFDKPKGNTYAQIEYKKSSGKCDINFDLIKEISDLFSLKESDTEKIIGMWVEKTLNMKVKKTGYFVWND
jgi:hypothetical protein